MPGGRNDPDYKFRLEAALDRNLLDEIRRLCQQHRLRRSAVIAAELRLRLPAREAARRAPPPSPMHHHDQATVRDDGPLFRS